MEKVRRKAHQYLEKQRRISRWHKVVTVLAGVVVFCTTYALILPALTMTTPLICGFETEHTHDESCYTVETVTNQRVLTCTEPEVEPHTHDESCYTAETRYLCGLEAIEGHTHSDECNGLVRDELICTVEFDTVETQVEREIISDDGESTVVTDTETETVPHEHTDECYSWVEALPCGLEETEGHVHTEECGTETVEIRICETEETEGHIHSDECYVIPENEGEAIEVRTLTCEIPEHTHHDNCYLDLELEEQVVYYCGFDTEHTHNEDCYFEDETLKCTIAEHTHTDECLAEPVELVTMDLDETLTAETEDGLAIITVHVTGEVILPEDAQLELVVTENYGDDYDEYYELAEEQGDVLAVMVYDYAIVAEGQELDLAQCDLSAGIEFTEIVEQMLNDPGMIMAATYDLDNEADEAAKPELQTITDTRTPGKIRSAVISGANPRFTVEYYAYLERVVRTDSGYMAGGLSHNEFVASGKLPIINTDHGSTAIESNKKGLLPENGNGRYDSPNGNPIAYLTLNADGTVKTERTLTQIYQDKDFEYQRAPGLMYFNVVLRNDESKYKLTEIWVKDGDGDWDKRTYHDSLYFTNREETAAEDPDRFILIQDNTVIRLVYDTVGENTTVSSNFYDYDITDGKIYTSVADATNQENGYDLSKQTETTKWYMNAIKHGINSEINYTGSGSRLAFGNGNTGSGWQNVTRNGFNMNQLNLSSFSLCHFGLAKGATPVTVTDEDGNERIEYRIRYADNVTAPNLFNDGSAEGKTGYDADLTFDRVGDTYTLKMATIKTEEGREITTGGLNTFVHPSPEHTHLYTNNFWPMDEIAGNDMRFGKNDPADSIRLNRLYLNGSDTGEYLPEADNKKDHNSYFGMQFAVTFDLTRDYVGPLEYYFFGDDDMWVFLDDTLICDIGGVHTSVGEYVNLWDYIDRSELGDEPKTYTLTFYYTERGASGSTCWMQFTLPTVVGLDLERELEKELDSDNGSLWIEKQVSGITTTGEFKFRLDLEGVNTYDNFMVRDQNGNVIRKGEGVMDFISDGGEFVLRHDEVLVVHKLPIGTKYTITEIDPDGYHTKSTTELNNVTTETEGVIAKGVISGYDQRDGQVVEKPGEDNEAKTAIKGLCTKVVFINSSSYELPATGGSGTILWYAMGILLVAMAVFLMYNNIKKQRGDAVC